MEVPIWISFDTLSHETFVSYVRCRDRRPYSRHSHSLKGNEKVGEL